MGSDEQALAVELSGADRDARKASGTFFTPAPLVQTVLDEVEPLLPDGPFTVLDPACGAGAFLAAAGRRWPRAALLGWEKDPGVAAFCQARIPRGTVLTLDALESPWTETVPPAPFTLLLGNPPWNGRSALLDDKARHGRLRALHEGALPKGTSLRDDFVFFLLRAAEALRERPGAVAFLTPASLLDAFLYQPLRRALGEALRLESVLDLGGGVFEGAQVRSCLTLWSTRPRGVASYRSRARGGRFEEGQLSPAQPLLPAGPSWSLVPVSAEAAALDSDFQAHGEPLSALVPVSLPGLKTRFDELLTDSDPARLLARIDAFLSTPEDALGAFADAFALPRKLLPKLLALKAFVPSGTRADQAFVRPFLRYNGPCHKGGIPESARGHCYLDRMLIPRGDHRLRGDWDPHAHPVKLVFNTLERPLSALVVTTPGCVHAYRHTRFAPLHVPRALRDGPFKRRLNTSGDLVPNLSPRGLDWARTLGGPEEAFRAVTRFINSKDVQEHWAPAFASSRELWVPFGSEHRG